jgi:hypothetical protein
MLYVAWGGQPSGIGSYHRQGGSIVRRLRVLALVGAVLVALGSVVATAGPAAADDDVPAAPAEYNRWYNGCTSPFGEAPGGNTFTDACNWHDLCYAGRIAG